MGGKYGGLLRAGTSRAAGALADEGARPPTADTLRVPCNVACATSLTGLPAMGIERVPPLSPASGWRWWLPFSAAACLLPSALPSASTMDGNLRVAPALSTLLARDRPPPLSGPVVTSAAPIIPARRATASDPTASRSRAGDADDEWLVRDTDCARLMYAATAGAAASNASREKSAPRSLLTVDSAHRLDMLATLDTSRAHAVVGAARPAASRWGVVDGVPSGAPRPHLAPAHAAPR